MVTGENARTKMLESINKDIKAYHIDPKKEILMGYFVFNKENNTVTNIINTRDSFPKIFMNEIQGKTVQTSQDEKGYHIAIVNTNGEKQEIATIKNGQLISLTLSAKTIDDYCLEFDTGLEELTLLGTTHIGKRFLCYNEKLHQLIAKNVEEFEPLCLRWNTGLTDLDLPNHRKARYGLLDNNKTLRHLYAPQWTDFEPPHASIGAKGADLAAPFFKQNTHLRQKAHSEPLKERLDTATKTPWVHPLKRVH